MGNISLKNRGKKEIAPFPEDAVVVTKDWVVSQYNKYICRKKKKK